MSNVESSYQKLANEVGELVRIGRETLEILSQTRGSVEKAKNAAISELIRQAEDLQSDLMVSAYDYERESAPTNSVNPKKRLAKWLDLTTGSVWVCRDNTPNNNIWVTSDASEAREAVSRIEKLEKELTNAIKTQKDSNATALENCLENVRGLIADLEARTNKTQENSNATALENVRGLIADLETRTNGVDFIAIGNPTTNANPQKANALWLNQKTSVIYTCIDNTLNDNVWVGNGGYIGGIFRNFQPADPNENTQGVFYFNISTQKVFVKYQDKWVEIAEIKNTEDMSAETTQEKVLYAQGLNLYYMQGDTPIYTLDYAQNDAPTQTINPSKRFALFLDTQNNVFYVCTNNATDANVWEKMDTKNIHAPNIITKPSLEVRPSEPGFGGGLASDMALKRLGLEKLSGTEDKESIEYANYVHTATGSIMHFTPAMYQKITFESGAPYYGIKIEYSLEKKEGFVLNRSFINGGRKIEGFFMDKFVNSFKDGKNVSVQNGIPLSLHPNYQPISQFGVSHNFGGYIDAAKKRGGTFLMPLYMWRHYINLMLAKYQTSYMAGTCYEDIAWCNTIPHVVRGCNNGTLSDHIDNSVQFTATGDGRGGKAGGVSTELDLKKISLFGDGASPCDFNGPMFMVTQGVNGNNGKLGILKKDVDIQGLTYSNAHNVDFYDYFTLPFSGVGYYGGGSEQCLCGATKEDTDEWRKDCLGIPKEKYTSSAEIFGGDSITLAAHNACMPLVGANYNLNGIYGAFYANLITTANSYCGIIGSVCNKYNTIKYGYSDGFRACAVGEVLR